MQSHWLNKKNNDNLIIFFAGWSFDFKPFEFLDCGNFDVLMFYDYSSDDYNCKVMDIIGKYKQYFLIAWSMGVYKAWSLRNILPDFSKKVAINGTPFPVHDEFGILNKVFLITLKNAEMGFKGKFYQNIFNLEDEYERYKQNPIERTIENRVQELHILYDDLKCNVKKYQNYYNLAMISRYDKIIPTKNQLNFWNSRTKVIMLESGHFPYYNFKSWNDIICN